MLAGRFEIVGDPEKRVDDRWLWRSPADEPGGPIPEDDLWIRGIDRTTSRTVWIDPEPEGFFWATDLSHETAARALRDPAVAEIAPIVHVGPGVVFGALPPDRERPRLTPEEAAACALEVCEVVARVHAVGVTGCFAFGPSHLRFLREGGDWHVRWRVPGRAALDYRELKGDGGDFHSPEPVLCDVHQVVRLFHSLAPGLADEQRITDLPPDIASLARRLVTIAGGRPDLQRRASRLPVIQALPAPRHDWDAMIDLGERLLPEHAGDLVDFIALPLAAAHHQRASRAHAAGDHESALRDAERAIALDPYPSYLGTRAVLLDRLGRPAEATRQIQEAIDSAEALMSVAEKEWTDRRAQKVQHLEELRKLAASGKKKRGATFSDDLLERYQREIDEWPSLRERLDNPTPGDRFSPIFSVHELPPRRDETARLHVIRALFLLRAGALDRAESDLRRALELHPTPLASRTLAHVLEARGDTEGAAEARRKG